MVDAADACRDNVVGVKTDVSEAGLDMLDVEQARGVDCMANGKSRIAEIAENAGTSDIGDGKRLVRTVGSGMRHDKSGQVVMAAKMLYIFEEIRDAVGIRGIFTKCGDIVDDKERRFVADNKSLDISHDIDHFIILFQLLEINAIEMRREIENALFIAVTHGKLLVGLLEIEIQHVAPEAGGEFISNLDGKQRFAEISVGKKAAKLALEPHVFPKIETRVLRRDGIDESSGSADLLADEGIDIDINRCWNLDGGRINLIIFSIHGVIIN